MWATVIALFPSWDSAAYSPSVTGLLPWKWFTIALFYQYNTCQEAGLVFCQDRRGSLAAPQETTNSCKFYLWLQDQRGGTKIESSNRERRQLELSNRLVFMSDLFCRSTCWFVTPCWRTSWWMLVVILTLVHEDVTEKLLKSFDWLMNLSFLSTLHLLLSLSPSPSVTLSSLCSSFASTSSFFFLPSCHSSWIVLIHHNLLSVSHQQHSAQLWAGPVVVGSVWTRSIIYHSNIRRKKLLELDQHDEESESDKDNIFQSIFTITDSHSVLSELDAQLTMEESLSQQQSL